VKILEIILNQFLGDFSPKKENLERNFLTRNICQIMATILQKVLLPACGRQKYSKDSVNYLLSSLTKQKFG
jgi:hypothetical protein